MRVTVVPEDSFVSVDNHGVGGVDCSGLDANIHAIQWYETTGEIEWKKTAESDRYNEVISSFEPFMFIVERHAQRIAELAAQGPQRLGE